MDILFLVKQKWVPETQTNKKFNIYSCIVIF